MISIVIPAYNAAPYLRRTVQSVVEQTCSDWELILVDDGSTDGTGALANELAAGDHRVRSFHQPNGGEVSARRTGVMQALGEWVMFVDADDVLPSDSVAGLLPLATPETDIVAGTMRVRNIGQDGTAVEDYVWQNRREGMMDGAEFVDGVLRLEIQMSACGKLYRRTLFDDFGWCLDRSIRQNPDLLMNVGLGLRARGVVVSNAAVSYNYIIHAGSASTVGLMPFDAWCKLFDAAAGYIGQYSEPERLADGFTHYRLSVFNNLLRHDVNDFSLADVHVRQTLRDSRGLALSRDERKVVWALSCGVLRRVFTVWQWMKGQFGR